MRISNIFNLISQNHDLLLPCIKSKHRFHHGSDIKLIMHLVAQMRIHCQLPPLPVVGQYQGQYLRYTQYWVLYVVEVEVEEKVEFDGEVEEEVEEEVEGGVEGEIEEEVEREVYVHRVEVVRLSKLSSKFRDCSGST